MAKPIMNIKINPSTVPEPTPYLAEIMNEIKADLKTGKNITRRTL